MTISWKALGHLIGKWTQRRLALGGSGWHHPGWHNHGLLLFFKKETVKSKPVLRFAHLPGPSA